MNHGGTAPPAYASPVRRSARLLPTFEALKVEVAVSEGRWLRVGQVAEILGVSVGTARNYADAGKFDRVRRLAGGDRRIWSEDVYKYLRQMEGEPCESSDSDEQPRPRPTDPGSPPKIDAGGS